MGDKLQDWCAEYADFISLKPQEFYEKIEVYRALLEKWQQKINLVSPASIADMDERHFRDSLQLLPYLPQISDMEQKKPFFLLDIGSGAGFPAMVLAMAREDIRVGFAESDTKKCTFLSTVSRETSVPVNIHNTRIEALAIDYIPDIISARALASLDKLFDFCLPFALENPEVTLLFLKGARAEEEIASAKQSYEFDFERFPSVSGDGCILKIRNLHPVS